MKRCDARRSGNRRRWAAAWALAALHVSGLVGCASAPAPRPRAGYHARVAVAMRDARTGRVERVELTEDFALGKRRRSVVGAPDAPIVIERPDLRVTWTLDPSKKAVEESSIRRTEPKVEAIPDPFRAQTSARFAWTSTENFEGERADRYAVSGGGYEGTAWLSIDRIPLRFEGTLALADRTLALEIRYREIRRARLSGALFEVPASYVGNDRRKQRLRRRQEDVDEAVRIMREQMNTAPRAPMSNPVPVF